MLNKVTIMGRLCADPELRQTQSGIPVCSCRIAVDRDYLSNGERETDFFDVVVWRGTAAAGCPLRSWQSASTLPGAKRTPHKSIAPLSSVWRAGRGPSTTRALPALRALLTAPTLPAFLSLRGVMDGYGARKS